MWPCARSVCESPRWSDGTLMVSRDLKRQLGVSVHREMMLEVHSPPATFRSAGCMEAYVSKGLDVVGTFLRRPGDSGILSGGCGEEETDSGGSPVRTSLARMQ